MRCLALASLVACVFGTLMGVVWSERVCYFSQEPDASQSGRLRWFMPGSKDDRCACTSTRPGPVYMQPVRWSHPPLYTDTPIFTNDQEDIHDYFNCHDLECAEAGPLGMEDGRIPDANITASTFWNNHAAWAPYRARLNLEGAAWLNAVSSDPNPWIQVDFGGRVIITGVITQGRDDATNQWVTEFQVAYGNDGQQWTDVTAGGEIVPTKFLGNSDRSTPVTTTFPEALQTRFLRILPTQWREYCSMRFEVLGCISHE